VTPVLPTSKRGWWVVAAIIGVALVGRLVLVAAIQGDYEPKTDALSFDLLATSIAQGDGFGQAQQPPMIGPTALRAPLYPLFLGAIYVVFGEHSYAAALAANAVLGVGVVALVGLVASQLLGRRIGAVAMALAAVHPAMYLTGSSLQLEPLLTLLCLGGLAAALQHRRAPRGILWPVVAGACIGIGMLAREQAFFFLPIVAWLVWTADRPRPSFRDRAGVRSVLVTGVAAVLVVIPWTIRNAQQLDAFVPVTTSSGFGLVGTYNETSLGNRAQWIPPYNDPRSVEVLLAIENPTEVRVDSELRSLSIEIVKENPTYPFKVAFWNTVRGFDLDGGDYTRLISPFLPYPQRLLDPAVYAGWLLLLAAVAGAFTVRARAVPRAVWVLPILLTGFMAVFLPFSIRYRSLLEPFSLFLAASLLVSAHDWWRRAGGTLWAQDLAVVGQRTAPAPTARAETEDAPEVVPAGTMTPTAPPAAPRQTASRLVAAPATEGAVPKPAATAKKATSKKAATAPAKKAAVKKAAVKKAAAKKTATKKAAAKPKPKAGGTA
jgi:hypothetical protein